jgi:hypothetical protein
VLALKLTQLLDFLFDGRQWPIRHPGTLTRLLRMRVDRILPSLVRNFPRWICQQGKTVLKNTAWHRRWAQG